MKREHGFTLLELLVAIAIFALVSAIAYGSLIHFMDDRAHLESEHEFWRVLSLTFIRMEDDFSQTRDRPIRDPIGLPDPQPPFRGQPTDTRATGAPTVELTRGGMQALGGGARSDLQRIGYRLEDGTLKRLVWPVLDPGPQTKPLELPLLKDVESFRVRFFSKSGAWLDLWPPQGSQETLPQGVEVTLTLKGRGEFKRLFLVNG